MADHKADDDGLTPNDAVLVARSFLEQYRADLQTCRAEPHSEVPKDHLEKFGRTGIRVFQPEVASGTRPCLLDCAREYIRLTEANPKFDIGVRGIAASRVARDGETVEADRILRSVIVIEGDTARIHIVKSLNECWRRFACAKELAHLIMGLTRGPIDLNPQVQLQQAFKIGDSAIDWSAGVSREVFAWLTAMELTLPYWDRQCLHRQIETKVDRMLIAQHFRVPKSVIDMYAETEYGTKSWAILATLEN